MAKTEETTKIAVIGMGYVGIPCAALLADVGGYSVIGIQRRSARSGWKIDALNQGRSPIEGQEPGLAELLERVATKGSFRVTDDFSVVAEMDIILIDVQTPTDGQDHQPTYDSLRAVCREVGARMKPGVLIITESTVAPGTTENVVIPILERRSGLVAGADFSVAYSYERVMPGRLIEYIINLPRIIGGIDKKSEERARQMYSRIVKAPLYTTDVLTAETSKVMENAYRDANIAFANEMALVCEKLGINVFEVRELINSRSERHMHVPGAGVGGHCLPKDTWLLRYGLKTYADPDSEVRFVSLARSINDYMPAHLFGLVVEGLQESGVELSQAKVAVLGVAYLENSDDTRNTPASTLVESLTAQGAQVIAHDPHVRPHEFTQAEVLKDIWEVLAGADAAALVTRHREYLDLDLNRVAEVMRTPILVDGRNVFDPESVRAAGFSFRAIGKGFRKTGG